MFYSLKENAYFDFVLFVPAEVGWNKDYMTAVCSSVQRYCGGHQLRFPCSISSSLTLIDLVNPI